MAKKPGILLYFEIKEPLKKLSNSDKGRLLDAILEYGESGTEPKFSGKLGIVWGFLKPKLDRDAATYDRTAQKRQYAVFCRELKRKGGTEITFEEWSALSDEERKDLLSCDTTRYPTITETVTVTPTITETVTETVAVAVTETELDDTAAATDRELKKMGGKLGQGVVVLSDAQIELLLDTLGLDMFDYYVDKLAAFIIKNGARVKNHYATIIKWWKEDCNAGGGRR